MTPDSRPFSARRRGAILAGAAALALLAAGLALGPQHRPRDLPPFAPHAPLTAADWDEAEAPATFPVLPLVEVAQRVRQRYAGRLLAAALGPPSPSERALGAALVYDLRLEGPDGRLLRLRLDARDGRFLDAAGRGLAAARAAARKEK